jgi:hypothetical protein
MMVKRLFTRAAPKLLAMWTCNGYLVAMEEEHRKVYDTLNLNQPSSSS